MIYCKHDNAMEIRSDKWQCVFAGSLFVILVSIPVYAILCLLFPQNIPSRYYLEYFSLNNGLWDMLRLSIPAILGFYVFRSTAKYRLYYNNEGVGQSDGFRNSFAKWENISSYTKQEIGSYKDRLTEPVLRDINAHIILKPFAPTIVTTSSIRNERAQFWKQVTDVIESRGSLQ